MTSAKSARKMTRKRARRIALRIAGKDAVRYIMAEHIWQATGMEPSNAFLLAERILHEVRPYLEAEARHAVENILHDPTPNPGKPGEES